MFVYREIICGFCNPKLSQENMGTIVVQSHSVLRFPSFSSFTNQPKLGNPIFSLRDVPPWVEGKDLRLTVSCIKADGNKSDRPTQRGSTSSGRKAKKEDKDGNSAVDEKRSSSSQEEIIAIFRRIQSSISQEKSIKYNINSNVSEEKSPAASILKVLRESGKKQGKAENELGNKTLTRRRSVPKKEQGIQGHPPVTDSNVTRPPSKFIRRSPIPSLTTPRGIILELNNDISSTPATAELEETRPEEMKLVELKGLAKSRGIKGYSKLKKSELINLLKS